MADLARLSEKTPVDSLSVDFHVACIRAAAGDVKGGSQDQEDFELFPKFGLDVAFCSGRS